MTAQTWTSLQTSLIAALAQAAPPYTAAISAGFTEQFPQATSYAEQRIYTEIPLLATRTMDTSLTTSANTPTIDLSTMANPVIEQEALYLITPSGAGPTNGTLHLYDKTTLDVLNMAWPQQSVTMSPTAAEWSGRYWAPVNDHVIAIGPTPDASYTAGVQGLFRPTPISNANQTTYLSTVYPALLQAACMVFLTGWLIRNFGAQSAQPEMAVSHESQYQVLLKAAGQEEARRRGLDPGDSSGATAPPDGG